MFALMADPTGAFQENHSILDGRIFGGDSVNAAIVSGGDVIAPVPGPIVGAGLPGLCWLPAACSAGGDVVRLRSGPRAAGSWGLGEAEAESVKRRKERWWSRPPRWTGGSGETIGTDAFRGGKALCYSKLR